MHFVTLLDLVHNNFDQTFIGHYVLSSYFASISYI